MILLVSLSCGILIFCIICMCLSGKAIRYDAVRKRVDDLSRNVTNTLLNGDNELDKSFMDRIVRPLLQKTANTFSSFLPNGRHIENEKQKKLLQQAGWTISVEEYTVIQMILMIGCGFLGLTVALITRKDVLDVILYFFFGVFSAYAVLRYYCSSAATRRKTAIEKQLPDLLDLFSVSVAAGLAFERAMLHVIETMDGPLVDEFAVTYREMSMGRSRKDALTLLSERCGVEDLTAVTGALVQAGQLGIPICNVLESQAAAIRRTRRSKVKEKAATVSTKMLLPMVGFIFPVLFIILLGPSLITILEQFG